MALEKKTPLRRRPNVLRLGLCCQFVRAPIKFRTTTATAMLRLPSRKIKRLPKPVRLHFRLENDEKVFTPLHLLPICVDTGMPLVYDVHHHRCLPDGQSVHKITERARKTWPAGPLCRISSPLAGWDGAKPERHHDYIDAGDFPKEWLGWPLTVEVEAKAKELVVSKLIADLNVEGGSNAS